MRATSFMVGSMKSHATPRVFVAGYQHETNTFAPTLADWSAFLRGDSFPAYMRGAPLLDNTRSVNLPIGGFIDEAERLGWTLIPSAWAGAIPSAHVTQDAFERIARAMADDLRAALTQGPLDGIYLDLHGAAVAEHLDDSEGELIARLRAIAGPRVPIVASLDLHANVSERMLAEADALAAYREYPHTDMAATGVIAARLLEQRWRLGRKAALHARRLPFLIALNAQSTTMAPAREVYQALRAIERETGVTLSFTMGFPAADVPCCGPVVWGHGDDETDTRAAVERLCAIATEPGQWRPDWLEAPQAVARALELAVSATQPVVLADTQDNPGAGGDSNTTGLLRALLDQGAGRRFPGRIALGLLHDPEAARAAHAAGVGARLTLALGKAVPTFTGQPSDPPVSGEFTVRALSDGRCTLPGPMMTGVSVNLGPSACLERDGVLVAVVTGKKQLLDRQLLRMVGIEPERMAVIAVKSSNHFRADFEPNASAVIIAKAAGPMAADPGDLPWTRLPAGVRTRP